MSRPTRILITTVQVGVHYGVVGQVRRRRDGRIIHTTAPRPYGMDRQAAADAEGWAIDRGYTDIERVDLDQLAAARWQS